jgi:hypothetical protein
MEIFKGGYAPKGWIHTQARLNGALEFVHDLANAKKALPMWLHGTTQHPSPPPSGAVAPKPLQTSLPPIE